MSGSVNLIGGDGNDKFYIESHSGNDTVVGGAGKDSLYLEGRATTDIKNLTTNKMTGITTITFKSDDQVLKVSGVETIHFTNADKTIV